MPFPEIKNPFKGLSKPQLTAVIVGTVGLGGFVEYKHHKSTGSWNPFSKGTSTADQIDPVTGLAYSQDNAVDPVTGLSYLAEAQQYGSVQAADSTVSAYGQTSESGTGVPGGPGPGSGGGGSNPSPNSVGSATYTSNAAWAQAATAGLADIGYPETAVATALGDYLTGTPVDDTQVNYINAALAEFGPPPIGVFQIIRKPIHTPGPDMKTVPYVIGLDLEEAQRDVSGAGLKSTAHGPSFVAGTGTRIVTAASPGAGTKLTANSTVKLTYKINKKKG